MSELFFFTSDYCLLSYLDGPKLIQSLSPRITTIAGRYFELRCSAETEEMLDIAYVWKHNGIKIRNIDLKNMDNRMVSFYPLSKEEKPVFLP